MSSLTHVHFICKIITGICVYEVLPYKVLLLEYDGHTQLYLCGLVTCTQRTHWVKPFESTGTLYHLI